MASLVIFHHDPRKTFFHDIDPRLKISVLIISAILVFSFTLRTLLVFGVFLGMAAVIGRLDISRVLRNGRPLWILIFILFASRLFGVPGLIIFRIPLMGLAASWEGFIGGMTEALRLVSLIILGHLFISVTSLSDLGRGLGFFLGFLPGDGGAKVVLFTGLTVSLVPLLLDTAEDILGAMACRGLSLRRHPISCLRRFTPVFFRKALRLGIETADAIESRGYRYDRSWKPFRRARSVDAAETGETFRAANRRE